MRIDDPADVPATARSRGSITVLHVDDDVDLADLVSTFLERVNERLVVETVTDADAALNRLDDGGVDCVVSDYDMPGRNGLELLRAVRERYPDLPFILFTGKGSEEIASEAISAGVTDYLQKGSGTDQYTLLANRIENAVTKHDAERMVVRAYQAMDTAREGIALIDESGQFRYVNQAYANVTGYERSELVGEHWELLYPESHVDRVYDEILPSVPKEGRWTGRTVYERADGEQFVANHALAYTDDETLICLIQELDGDADPVAGTTPDELLVDALDALEDVFYILDDEGTIQYVNRSVIGGVERSNLDSMATPALFHPDDRDDVEASIDRALATGNDRRELRLRVGEDEYCPYEFRSWTLDDATGEPRHVVGIGRDVSEQKDRELALNELHQTTRDLMRAESVDEIAEVTVAALGDILTLTHAGIHRKVGSEAALEPVAWTSEMEDVIGSPPTLGPDTLAWRVFESGELEHHDDLQTADRLHNDSTSLRSELIVPLGEYGVALVASTEPGAFDSNDCQLVQLLCENVTAAIERVEREAMLRQREAELQRENERLDEFASLVSHDLRNPLNVASGHLELASKGEETVHIEHAKQAIDRMETLIEDVLTLAREGECVDDTEPVALSAIVGQSWANVETNTAEYRLVDDAVIVADRSRLGQVFENLFRNSVEHGSTDNRRAERADDSVEHGSTNSQRDDTLTVTIGTITNAEGDPHGFYVEDDGVGIPADVRDRVFEAGYSTDGSGTGFGLRIVRDIVEAHGWSVSCTAGESGGARFEITGVEVR
ncbi:PAS domain S-box protein [Haloplanus sp. C73]|uniref:PAS domain-containing sensor histidine kinase n=1 Tax=Haloplanus sp. C73 TaxID=3421641 RepID=UPI003EC14F80